MTPDTPPPPPPAPAAALVQDSRVRMNTIGFLPAAPKQATVAAPCGDFRVVRVSDGKVVFTSSAGKPMHTPATDTDETVQIVDFSGLTEPGRYRVEIAGVGASDTFVIGDDVWNVPFEVVSRAMYLWRCGTAVETTWNGVTYRQEPCHTEDAWLDHVGGGHQQRRATGGWHDAGDYNKYVVNAGVSVGMMLKAWEHFGTALEKISAGIPESNDGVPDILNEIRWEAEWLLTMQMEDGRVYHKVSSLDFRYWGPPAKDHDPRYFSPWGTAATADFTAMLAGTARAWRPYDAAFADRCLAAARKSWALLLKTPGQVKPDLSAFKTGGYQADDGSHRLWAAAELWETTGDAACLAYFEKHASSFAVAFMGPGWGTVQDLGFATYLRASRSGERNPKVVAKIAADWLGVADKAVQACRESGYARPYGTDKTSWWWGCNGAVASQTLILHVADLLKPDPAYGETAQQSLAFLFGRNFNARSYVTGLGARPPIHPHDRRGEPAWPGYLVGGGWPDGRSWEDKLANYRVNEIAINWNTALIYALAGFVHPTQK
ncbi:endoglucanase [Opitutaceae bacterium EW11]|nr:endoglucanase [Opitutaceae bacterium EW11]